MTDKIFPEGFFFKKPHQNAPDFVKGKVSIKVDEFVAFAQTNAKNGWLNINLAESRGGKFYAELDTWEPDGSKASSAPAPAAQSAPPPVDDPFKDDIPF